MTQQEMINLVKILYAMGLKDHVGDFILGVEGEISANETARRCLSGQEEEAVQT